MDTHTLRRSAALLMAGAVVAAGGVALAAPGHDVATMAAPAGPADGARHDVANLPDDSHATDAQRAAARKLLVDAEADNAAYRDIAKAKAAGFDVQAAWDRKQAKRARLAAAHGREVGAKAKTVGLVHVPNASNRTDGRIQDPTAPETLIYFRAASGSFTLVGIMFTAERKAPPSTYQPYVRWHFHEACIDPNAAKGSKVKPLAHGASCPAGTTAHRSGSMTHLWFVAPDDLVHAYAMKVPLPQLKAYAAKTG